MKKNKEVEFHGKLETECRNAYKEYVVLNMPKADVRHIDADWWALAVKTGIIPIVAFRRRWMNEHLPAKSEAISNQNTTTLGILMEVQEERRKQIEIHGWTPEHDDDHTKRELVMAACAYAGGTGLRKTNDRSIWPWSHKAKVKVWESGGRKRLIKAMALLVAEVQRIDRAKGRAWNELHKDYSSRQRTERDWDEVKSYGEELYFSKGAFLLLASAMKKREEEVQHWIGVAQSIDQERKSIQIEADTLRSHFRNSEKELAAAKEGASSRVGVLEAYRQSHGILCQCACCKGFEALAAYEASKK